MDVGKSEDAKPATTDVSTRPMSFFAIPVLILLVLLWVLWRAFATPDQ
ncbi:MAG: hypothetical protein JNM86_10980 [Phycisphaerae bacterium]|nr:hypothetical protein [Phycisphaerae bacterium]